MSGKTGTTKSSVSIPPEVMARYNAVNAYAGDIAKTPFQAYQGQFVAGLTPTQQAGIRATSQYSQAAQPYYQAATGQLMQAQQSAMPGISAAYQNVGGAQDIGSQYAQAATQNITGAQEQAMPYYGMASQGLGAAMQYGQPYLGGATTAAMAGAQGISPESLNIGAYMSPYTQAVADTTYQALRQQQQQEMAGQTANAIRSGAFGGDRSGLVAANLARQQQLGTAQAMAPIYQQGYGQALAAAQQQQGVGLSAAQANRAALQNLAQQLQGIGQQGYAQQLGGAQFAQQLGQGLYGMGTGTGQALASLGQQQYGQGMGAAQQLAGLAQQGYGMGAATSQALAGLGQGAQQSALQGAQAQLGAGTLEQQTQQADLTAQYQQFLQERGYPFQVAQFLANIAMGTGALSGQTTTTTQPMPFFSDRRVKHDVKEIGETHDGQPIYSFKYNGDNATQIGLMAQDVEKHHPEAVYDMGGVKGVDYKQATQDAERKERYEGGLVPASMGGAVTEPGAYGRGGYYDGGSVDPNDIQALLAQQQQAFGPFGETGIYGQSQHEAPFAGAKGVVPQGKLHVPKMMRADTPPPLPEGMGTQMLNAYDQAMGMKRRYDEAKEMFKGKETSQEEMDRTRQGQSETDRSGLVGPDIVPDKSPEEEKNLFETLASIFGRAEGGAIPRMHYEAGGMTGFSDPYRKYKGDEGQVPEEILDIENKLDTKKPTSPASSPTSQTGLSVSDAISLGKFIMPFFLKDGGIVPRHGYATEGSVEPVEEIEKPKGVVPRSIRNNNPGNIKDSEFARRQPGYAGSDGTFARFDSPESGAGAMETLLTSYANRGFNTPASIIGRWSPQADPENAPGSTSNYASYVANKLGIKPDEPIDVADPKIRANLRTAMSEFESGIKPTGVPARNVAIKSEGVKPETFVGGLKNYLQENQSWLSPLGAGIRGMVQSRSPFLGGALLEGIGTGLEAVSPAQKALADIALTQAQKEQTMGAIPRTTELEGLGFFLVRQPDGNYAWVRRMDYKPEMGAKVDPSMVPKHQLPPVPVEQKGAEKGAPSTQPKIEAPKTISSAEVAKIDQPAVSALDKEIAESQNMPPAQKSDFVSPAIAEGASAAKLSYDLNTYGGALSMLPADSLIAGSVFAPVAIEGKKAIDKILDQFGLKDYIYESLQPDLTGVNFAEEVAKIKSALSTSRTGEAGQRAVSAIDKFGEMFPDITTSFTGRRDNTASILVRNMQDLERGVFAEQWRSEGVNKGVAMPNRMSDGMNREFERLTQDQYRMDKDTLKKMFETKMQNGKTWLYYLATLDKPLSAEQIDYINQTFKNPAIFRYFPNIKVQ